LPRHFDIETFQKIARWVGVRDGVRLDGAGALLDAVGECGQANMSTPDAIEAHLRADRNLDQKSADFLAELVRTAYVRLADDQPMKGNGRKVE
jgi:hypothetical protein